ncbi:MAG: GNAT family N-acetyltransferase [Leptolyngbya sp. BL-A-14]
MTHDSTRSPNAPLFVVRPAQVSDRKRIEQLVSQFHQSLQLGGVQWRPSQLEMSAIVFAWIALLVVLALYGLFPHAIALALLLAFVLRAPRETDQSLAHFWVAEHNGEIIGCAKLFCYNTYSEAYLVYIAPAWRGQGYGSHLVARLTKEATLPLYLASQPHRMQFYMRLGFVPLPPDALPMIVRHRLGIDRYQKYGVVGMVFGQR